MVTSNPAAAFLALVQRTNAERLSLALSIAAIAVCAAIPEDSRPWLVLKIFLLIGGTVNGGTIVIELFNSMRYRMMWQEAAISAYRKENGLPLLKHERKNIQPSPEPIASPIEPPQPVTIWQPIRTFPSAVSVSIKRYEEPPTRAFLEALFSTAAANGRIQSESSFAALGKGQWTGTQSNTWLTYCDEQRITEKAYQSSNGNSPRRIVPGVTLEIALARFGLSSAPNP